MDITNLINVLPWHPTKRWAVRTKASINTIVVHQAASAGTIENINKYHITPTSDRDHDGDIEGWEKNHISPTGCPHICLDDQTEILTNSGWKLFKELSKKEKVATLNQNTHKFEWQDPTDYITQNYSGTMLLHSTRHVEFCVTPNHRLYVSKRTTNGAFSDNWSLEFAEKIQENYYRQKYRFIRSSEGFDRIDPEFVEIGPYKINFYDYLELMAWIISEGNTEKNNNRVSITQSLKANPENCKKIQILLDKISTQIPNFKWTFSSGKSFRFSNKELADYIKTTIGDYSYNKVVPSFIKESSPEALKFFLETLVLGDGTKNGDGWVYYSTSKILLDDVQEIAIKAGLCSVIKWGIDRRDSTHFSINKLFSFKRVSGYASITSSYKTPSLTQPLTSKEYNGKIYCVSVPNEIILTRRNGKAIWLGNCYHYAIRPTGEVCQCNNLTDITWHVKNANTRAVGILVCGNFNGPGWTKGGEPTPQQIKSLKELLNHLNITVFPNIAKTEYKGHCELQAKPACPGTTLMNTLKEWRES